MDENSKQFIAGIVFGAGGVGVLASYIWNGTIKRLERCEEQCDKNHDAISSANGRIDGLELVCDERHSRKRK